jgi:hypothetical protein
MQEMGEIRNPIIFRNGDVSFFGIQKASEMSQNGVGDSSGILPAASDRVFFEGPEAFEKSFLSHNPFPRL